MQKNRHASLRTGSEITNLSKMCAGTLPRGFDRDIMCCLRYRSAMGRTGRAMVFVPTKPYEYTSSPRGWSLRMTSV